MLSHAIIFITMFWYSHYLAIYFISVDLNAFVRDARRVGTYPLE
jgi:hypothetical protein